MKEKSVAFSSGYVSPGGGKSAPSVESMSVLERSKLVLLWSLEKSWWSTREAGSVWEDSEDGWLFGGCFLVEMTSFSEEGDSGAKLQIKKTKSMRLQGKQIHARRVWIRHIQQMINKGRTETTVKETKASLEAAGTSSKGANHFIIAAFIHSDLQCIE